MFLAYYKKYQLQLWNENTKTERKFPGIFNLGYFHIHLDYYKSECVRNFSPLSSSYIRNTEKNNTHKIISFVSSEDAHIQTFTRSKRNKITISPSPNSEEFHFDTRVKTDGLCASAICVFSLPHTHP